MPEPAGASSTSSQTISYRPSREDLTEDEGSSQRLADGETAPQALIQARSGGQEVTGKPGNPATIAQSMRATVWLDGGSVFD
jgi:hypothetical protein